VGPCSGFSSPYGPTPCEPTGHFTQGFFKRRIRVNFEAALTLRRSLPLAACGSFGRVQCDASARTSSAASRRKRPSPRKCRNDETMGKPSPVLRLRERHACYRDRSCQALSAARSRAASRPADRRSALRATPSSSPESQRRCPRRLPEQADRSVPHCEHGQRLRREGRRIRGREGSRSAAPPMVGCRPP